MGFMNVFVSLALGCMMLTLSSVAIDTFWVWEWMQYVLILFALTIAFALVSAILSYIFESKKKQTLIAHYLSALDNHGFLLGNGENYDYLRRKLCTNQIGLCAKLT